MVTVRHYTPLSSRRTLKLPTTPYLLRHKDVMKNPTLQQNHTQGCQQEATAINIRTTSSSHPGAPIVVPMAACIPRRTDRRENRTHYLR